MTFYRALEGPWLHVATLDLSAITDRVHALVRSEPALAVRVVRGAKMADERGLFNEFSAAFQFPYYFGENWDAFDECINDFSWLPASGYLAVITAADELLSDSKEQLAPLLRILSDAGRDWAQPSAARRPWAPQAHPFHCVLQTAPSSCSLVTNALTSAGVEYRPCEWA